ncbi:hypothetical protein KI387_032489, partial [Taxus chinensis]
MNMAIDKIKRGDSNELVDLDFKIEENHEVKAMVGVVSELEFECLTSDKDFRRGKRGALVAVPLFFLFSSWCGSSSKGIRKVLPPSLKEDVVHPSSNGDMDGSPMGSPASPISTPLAENKENDVKVVLKVCIKSSMKKPCVFEVGIEEKRHNEHGTDCKMKRKVQWIDAHGQDLAQIKEFEQRISQ